MQAPVSDQAIRAALSFVPANDRELWIRIGMALKSHYGDGGFEAFEAWSSSADNFNAKTARATWKSFKASGGIQIGTLFHEASKHGFDLASQVPAEPLSSEELRRKEEKREALQRAEAEERARKEAEAAKEARRMWSATADSGVSPYLGRKKVDGHGVRFQRDVVLVPVRDVDGHLWNLQRLYATGKKVFLEGGRVSGCFHVLGDIAGAPWVLVAEGYATAAALHQATSRPVVVGFNTMNLRNVAAVLRGRYKEMQILLCADDDSETEAKRGKNPGISMAMEVAEAVQGHWCRPVGLPQGGTDFNDLACHAGIQAVREQVEAAIEAAGKAKEPKRERPKASSRKKSSSAAEAPRMGAFFNVDERGVWYHGFGTGGAPLPPHWICKPMKVVARSRGAENGEWGYLLEFEDADGNLKRWAMPASMLAAEGAAYRSILMDMGLDIGLTPTARTQLSHYIQTTQTDVRVRCTDRIGWHGDVYVLPDRTIGNGEENVIFQAPGGVLSQFKQKGSLQEWRENIASLCRGNSRMLFCVSAAFAAPLLHLAGVASGGFHIWGDSSSGKSTAFRVAGSVYGGKDYPRNWRMTDNALETVAAQHSDALLLLDEIAQVDPKVVGDTVYMLANETGKGRATQTATARRTYTWRVLFLSDGEVSLANHMAEAGKGTKGGHDVRMAHITADAGKGFGVYDTLHDFADGASLSNHLVSMAQRHYGTAGIAFIEWAAANAERLSSKLRFDVDQLAKRMCPENSHGQVSRVASRFALVGIAGEFATKAGITGWDEGEAVQAAETCFAAWLEGRGGAGNAEHAAILRQVTGFMQVHGDSRFVWWHRAVDDRKPSAINRAGFKKLVRAGAEINTHSDHHKEFGDVVHPADLEGCEIEYYIFPEVFRNEICKGFNPKLVVQLLLERNLLIPEKSGDRIVRADRKERLPGTKGARCYRFASSIVSGDFDPR